MLSFDASNWLLEEKHDFYSSDVDSISLPTGNAVFQPAVNNNQHSKQAIERCKNSVFSENVPNNAIVKNNDIKLSNVTAVPQDFSLVLAAIARMEASFKVHRFICFEQLYVYLFITSFKVYLFTFVSYSYHFSYSFTVLGKI